MAWIEAERLKKKALREEARGPRMKWARMARMEHAIGQIPEETASKVKGVVEAVVKKEADGLKEHITSELDARLGRRPSEGESAEVAIARLKVEMETVKNLNKQDKEEKKAAAVVEKKAAAAAKKAAAEDKKKAAGKAKGKAKGRGRDLNDLCRITMSEE